MSTVYSPPVRTPFTDLTGAIISHQWHGSCADMEMKVIDCLDAYGLTRGKVKCKDLMDDFKECYMRTKQRSRVEAMKDERERQYKAGERSDEDHYLPAPKRYGY